MATIMAFVLLIASIFACGYWLLKAPFFSETLQKKKQYSGCIGDSEVVFCVMSSTLVMLLPLNDDESLKEKEIKDKSFEKAVNAMICDGFSEAMSE
jgi:hypothetical protein